MFSVACVCPSVCMWWVLPATDTEYSYRYRSSLLRILYFLLFFCFLPPTFFLPSHSWQVYYSELLRIQIYIFIFIKKKSIGQWILPILPACMSHSCLSEQYWWYWNTQTSHCCKHTRHWICTRDRHHNTRFSSFQMQHHGLSNRKFQVQCLAVVLVWWGVFPWVGC